LQVGGGRRSVGVSLRANEFAGHDGVLEFEAALKFRDLPDIADEWTLVFTYPKECEIKQLPFRIADVPMPQEH
jgi:hypothetical protein